MEDEKLLLAEYNHFSESFWRNEELGERRVNFFISLTTAIIAGIVALFTTNIDETNPILVKKISTLALIGNLLFGIVTLVRILWRNQVTEEYKSILRFLREELKTRSKGLNKYKLPFNTKKWWFTGGLADMVATINSIILIVLIAIWFPVWWVLILIFVTIFAFQKYFIGKRKKKSEIQKEVKKKA